jgi:hypothetical protein
LFLGFCPFKLWPSLDSSLSRMILSKHYSCPVHWTGWRSVASSYRNRWFLPSGFGWHSHFFLEISNQFRQLWEGILFTWLNGWRVSLISWPCI